MARVSVNFAGRIEVLINPSLLYWGTMAKENLYQAVSVGSGTFLITKPKRKASKRRQSKLKGTVRGARKS